jgi:twitching motility protein PilT
VSAFPLSEQQSLRGRLAKTLRYVISQQLVPRKDGGRVAILEVFKNTNRTRQYLECEDSSGENLLEAVKNGAMEGMQHFDAELERLVRADAVDVQTALSYASDAQQLQSALSRRLH